MKRLTNLIMLCGIVLWAACSNDSEILEQAPSTYKEDVKSENAATRSYKNVVSIKLETPGTLKELLGDKLTTTDKLVLSGGMDADDANTFLNEMTALVALDLTDATFVETDKTFCNNAYNKSDALSLVKDEVAGHMFSDSKFVEVSLPKNLKRIGEFSFDECFSLENVKCPEKLTSIGKSAFWRCWALKTISLPEGLETIDDKAFSESAIEEISLPESLKKIGVNAFEHCNFSSINLPKNLAELGTYAFDYCGDLKGIDVPSSISELPTGCFRRCSSLETVVLPDNMTVIGSHAFEYAGKLKDINLPQSLKVIGQEAFANCSALDFASGLPESLETINKGSFSGMKSLKAIAFPDKITSIPENLCRECRSLQSVTLPQNCTYIGKSAFQESGLTAISIPTTCTEIENYAFYKCTNLSSVIIQPNNTLKSLRYQAFAYTSLSSFDFSHTVLETIDYSAFDGSHLEGVLTFPSTLKSIGDNAFKNNPVTAIYLTGTGEISLGNLFGSASNCLIYTQSETITTHVNIPNVIAKHQGNYCISLQLVENDSFRCPEAFTAGKVTFTKSFNRVYWGSTSTAQKGKASNWYALSLPFTVETITYKGNDGQTRTFAPFNAGVEGAKPFWLRKFSKDDSFENVTKIEAGEPYIIAFPNYTAYLPEYNVAGDVVFSAKGPVTIPVTEEYEVNGSIYKMKRSYEIRPQSAFIYLLNSPRGDNPTMGESGDGWGSVFLPGLRDSWAFEAYIIGAGTGNGVENEGDDLGGMEGATGVNLPPLRINSPASTRSTHEIGSIPSIDDM